MDEDLNKILSEFKPTSVVKRKLKLKLRVVALGVSAFVSILRGIRRDKKKTMKSYISSVINQKSLYISFADSRGSIGIG